MPWTGSSFKKHNKRLSPSQSAKAARIANAILKSGGSEGVAIATANKQAKRRKKGTSNARIK